MDRLTRDGAAGPVSRDQILRRERGGRGNVYFSCSAGHEQDWQPYLVDPYPCYMYVMTIHRYTHLRINSKFWQESNTYMYLLEESNTYIYLLDIYNTFLCISRVRLIKCTGSCYASSVDLERECYFLEANVLQDSIHTYVLV